MVNKRKFLMLGFYDRGNPGDEAFMMVFPLFFKHLGINDVDFSFACTDDIDEIPDETDAVVMAGGDTITPYFMEKVVRMLKSYKGPVYGVSVGLPYDADSKYLHVFDHVFVRSQYDACLASSVIGARKVTYMPDITLVWQTTTKAFSVSNPFLNTRTMPSSQRPNGGNSGAEVGVCVAAPLLKAKPRVFDELVSSLIAILDTHANNRLHFYAFNTNVHAENECDTVAMQQVHDSIIAADAALDSP
jgi:hypothetical protein